MTFENLQVPLERLPRASELEFQPMAPDYFREVLTQSVITWAGIIALSVIPAIAVAKPEELKARLLLLPIGLLLLAALSTTLSWFGAKAKGVALREHDIAYRSGLIWRKTILLSFNRIQHIELSRGPLQRRFGLASLKFFTAGGMHVDMKIDGLRHADASRLRELILAKIGRASITPTSNDIAADAPAAPPKHG